VETGLKKLISNNNMALLLAAWQVNISPAVTYAAQVDGISRVEVLFPLISAVVA